jgi:hypothetical protein
MNKPMVSIILSASALAAFTAASPRYFDSATSL